MKLFDSVLPQKKRTALGGLESVHVNPINAYESLFMQYLTADCIFAFLFNGPWESEAPASLIERFTTITLCAVLYNRKL